MKCRNCRERKNVVLETRRLDNTIWRRRKCSRCEHIFETCETFAEELPEHARKASKGVRGVLVVKPNVNFDAGEVWRLTRSEHE